MTKNTAWRNVVFSVLGQISAATCFLRGRAYEALENRALARQWLAFLRDLLYQDRLLFLLPLFFLFSV